jgi:hypothetical protein
VQDAHSGNNAATMIELLEGSACHLGKESKSPSASQARSLDCPRQRRANKRQPCAIRILLSPLRPLPLLPLPFLPPSFRQIRETNLALACPVQPLQQSH